MEYSRNYGCLWVYKETLEVVSQRCWFSVSDDKASPGSRKTLHKAIKKTQEDIVELLFLTPV